VAAGKVEIRVGDTVRVVAYTPGKYAPGVKDELGTERLFKSLVGRTFRVFGKNRVGLELQPTWRDTVWIPRKDVQLERKGYLPARSRKRRHKSK
jgi:hypothetical protein